MTKVVTGIFNTALAAQEALYKLENSGFSQNQINLVAAEETAGPNGHNFGIQKDSKAAEGGTIGAASGGIIGAIAAGLLATGSIAIPGLNLLVWGTAIAAIAGAGAGAAAGGLTGALIGLGIPEYEVKQLEGHVQNGAVLVAVQTETDVQEAQAKDIFKRTNAQSIAA